MNQHYDFKVKDPFTMLDGTDKGLIIEFFGLISRMEYAVMLRGHIRGDKEQMMVNWVGFARQMNGMLIAQGDKLMNDAIDYLNKNPPMELLKDRTWRKRKEKDGLAKDALAIIAATNVRNNLFHGAKFNNPDKHRNNELLESAIIVFEGCLMADHELKIWFET